MSYKAAILNHAPKYWDPMGDEQTELGSYMEEYRQIKYEARHAVQDPNKSIAKIVRVQNIHDLGQLLIREQLLLVANSQNSYYRVRRFIKLEKAYLAKALKYNLDHRRCNISGLEFKDKIRHTEFRPNDILVAVQVVTSTPDQATIIPSNNLEYFIDYLVYFS